MKLSCIDVCVIIRLCLERECDEKDKLAKRAQAANLEAAERKRDAEAKEAERIDTNNQCKKMLSMVEQRVCDTLFLGVG